MPSSAVRSAIAIAEEFIPADQDDDDDNYLCDDFRGVAEIGKHQTSPIIDNNINEEDLITVLTENPSIDNSADIFYAMMNGESLDGLSQDGTLESVEEEEEILNNNNMRGQRSLLSQSQHSRRTTSSSSSSLDGSLLDDNDGVSSHNRRRHKLKRQSSSRKKNCSNNIIKRGSSIHRRSSSNNTFPPTEISIDENNEESYYEDIDEFGGDTFLELNDGYENENENNRLQRNPISETTKEKEKQQQPNPNKNSIFYQMAHQVRLQYELREKADMFKEFVDVRDRTKNMVLYKNCFIGSEAVDAMLYNDIANTREEAVAVGREMQRSLKLFRSARGFNKETMFEDSDMFFQYMKIKKRDGLGGGGSSHGIFDCGSSCDGLSVRSGSRDGDGGGGERLSRMAKAFRECVDVRDRQFRFKTYKSCFVGSDAVNILVNTKLCATRQEAVQLGRELQRELDFFQHVTGDHAFSDGKLFFRFREDGGTDSRILPISLATL